MGGRMVLLCVGKAVTVTLTYLLSNNDLVEGNKFFICPASSEDVSQLVSPSQGKAKLTG